MTWWGDRKLGELLRSYDRINNKGLFMSLNQTFSSFPIVAFKILFHGVFLWDSSCVVFLNFPSFLIISACCVFFFELELKLIFYSIFVLHFFLMFTFLDSIILFFTNPFPFIYFISLPIFSLYLFRWVSLSFNKISNRHKFKSKPEGLSH